MNKLLKFYLLFVLSSGSYLCFCYSWDNLFEDIQEMPQCNNPATQKDCQKIKDEISEFKKAFDTRYQKNGWRETELEYVKHPYFKELADQVFPNIFTSEKEERIANLFIFTIRLGYRIDGQKACVFLRNYLNYRLGNDISLKSYITMQLKNQSNKKY